MQGAVFYLYRIHPRAHTRVYVYITPSELVEVSAAVPEGRNIIGRGVTPDKNVNTKQEPQWGGIDFRIFIGYGK